MGPSDPVFLQEGNFAISSRLQRETVWSLIPIRLKTIARWQEKIRCFLKILLKVSVKPI